MDLLDRLFARVVEGSSTKVPRKLADALPHLLWTYHMGVIMFWIHDTSRGCARTRCLARDTVDLVVKLILIAKFPLMRPAVRRVLNLTAQFGQWAPVGPSASP